MILREVRMDMPVRRSAVKAAGVLLSDSSVC
jgi:hypothetical protein